MVGGNTPERLRTSGEIAFASVVGCVVMCLGLAGAVWTIVQLIRWLAC